MFHQQILGESNPCIRQGNTGRSDLLVNPGEVVFEHISGTISNETSAQSEWYGLSMILFVCTSYGYLLIKLARKTRPLGRPENSLAHKGGSQG